MEITNEDINGLKQMDRIEYRQKRGECGERIFLSIISYFIGLIFLVIAIVIDTASVVDTNVLIAAIIAMFLFMFFSLFFAFSKNKELDDLNKEYFKIEKK